MYKIIIMIIIIISQCPCDLWHIGYREAEIPGLIPNICISLHTRILCVALILMCFGTSV